MDFTAGQQKLLAFWGIIVNGVEERWSTARLWEAIHSEAEARGWTLTGAGAVDLNRIRSLAAEQRDKSDNFMSAGPDQTIDASMIASDVSARPQQDQNLAPSWHVRFEHQVLIDGELVKLWRTSTFDGSLPPTAGALRDAVEQDAQAMADDYSETHVGVGAIRISAV